MQWSRERLRIVIQHELAHVYRHDWLTMLLVQCLGVFHWVNPLYWCAYNRLRIERELACDDYVVRNG